MRSLALVCLCLCALSLPCFSQTGGEAFSQGGTALPEAASEEAGLEIGVAAPNRNLTITESADFENLSPEDIGGDFHFETIDENVSEALTEYAAGQQDMTADEDGGTMQSLILAAAIEWLLVALVLHITLGVSGLSGTLGRAAATAAVIALAGGTIGYFLQADLLNPIRIGVGFLLLIMLLSTLFKIQSWVNVFRTALLVQVISLGLVWLGHSAASTLLGF